MKVFYGLIALIWAGNFVALFFGYEPDRFEIGLTFFITMVYFIFAMIYEGRR